MPAADSRLVRTSLLSCWEVCGSAYRARFQGYWSAASATVSEHKSGCEQQMVKLATWRSVAKSTVASLSLLGLAGSWNQNLDIREWTVYYI